MTDILRTIFNFIIWVFIPVTLLGVIWFMGSVPGRIEDKRHRSAARAGFWAGIMLFIIILIYQVNIFLKISFPHNEIFQGFSIQLALSSALITFLLFLGGKKIIPPGASGWLVLVLTFVSSSALLHYLFIRTYNDLLLSIILGALFGLLTHFAAFPSSLKEFLKAKNFPA